MNEALVKPYILVQASYYEAVCEQILPEDNSVVACFPKDVGFPQACFKVRGACGSGFGPA